MSCFFGRRVHIIKSFLIAECRRWVGLGLISTSVGWVGCENIGLVGFQKSDARPTMVHPLLSDGVSDTEAFTRVRRQGIQLEASGMKLADWFQSCHVLLAAVAYGFFFPIFYISLEGRGKLLPTHLLLPTPTPKPSRLHVLTTQVFRTHWSTTYVRVAYCYRWE